MIGKSTIMEVGIKFYSHNTVNRTDFDFADFVEILPVPQNPLGVFSQHEFKYRIHCAHDAFGFNPSNTKQLEHNKAIIKQAIWAADELRADRIVVHAGFNTPELNIKNPMKKSLSFLTEMFDDRICIENLLPLDGNLAWVAYSPEEITAFKDEGFKFCLDFGHAVSTAAHLGKDYKEYVNQFAGLNPDYFHLSGSPLYGGDKHHLTILESDADIEFFKKIIKKADKPVCLETPLNAEQRKKEVMFLKN
ncbi:TIM barrel protein [Candidatus Woesearchaeota archaeon]|nr:TIM barrel protein [Candidatus Woesearchaeota archaeon]